MNDDIECPRCDGDGIADEDIDLGDDTCDLCGGAGRIERQPQPRVSPSRLKQLN